MSDVIIFATGYVVGAISSFIFIVMLKLALKEEGN